MFTKRSRLFLSSLLLSLVVVLLSGCGETHKTYDYGNFTRQLSAKGMEPGKKFFTFHPGEQIALKWNAVPSQDSSESSASAVKIFAELHGPYANEDATKKAIKLDHIDGSLVTSMPTITTTDWTNTTYQYNFVLSQTLKPGFYILTQRVDSALATNSFNSELQIL